MAAHGDIYIVANTYLKEEGSQLYDFLIYKRNHSHKSFYEQYLKLKLHYTQCRSGSGLIKMHAPVSRDMNIVLHLYYADHSDTNIVILRPYAWHLY